ncbi:MAG TPA: hypothetical protein VED20_12555 [Streptosporangiaceae bacterium]|nr:hypothetical protein [Streptosporangiaceae bacterium]
MQVAAYDPDQAAVGGRVVIERAGKLTAGDHRSRERVVPAGDAFSGAEYLMAGGAHVAARWAVVASPQVQDRVSLQAQSGDPGGQPGHVGQRHPFRAALGQVRAERVIEPARCGRGPGRVAGRSGERGRARVGAGHPESHRVGEVACAVGVRLGQRPAERGRRAARPEQDTHDQAHAGAYGHVFDPHQTDTPPGRLDDAEHSHQGERERRLPAGERDDRRSNPGREDR